MSDQTPLGMEVRFIWDYVRPTTALAKRRVGLLPTWIRFFSWFYLALGVVVPGFMLYSVVAHAPMTLTLFGFSHQGPALDAQSLIIAALMASNGVAAFGLISGRSWGAEGGILVGVAGLAMAIASMFVSEAPGLHLPLEPLFQVPFIWTLLGLRTKWQPDAGD